jgi:hypothetical protein
MKKKEQSQALLMTPLGEIYGNNPAYFHLLGYNAVKSVES